jgi:methionine synthase II (cobalamin-independent)
MKNNPYPKGTLEHDQYQLGMDLDEFFKAILDIISPPMIRFMDWLENILERINGNVNSKR